jgi:hypothetical protein
MDREEGGIVGEEDVVPYTRHKEEKTGLGSEMRCGEKGEEERRTKKDDRSAWLGYSSIQHGHRSIHLSWIMKVSSHTPILSIEEHTKQRATHENGDKPNRVGAISRLWRWWSAPKGGLLTEERTGFFGGRHSLVCW